MPQIITKNLRVFLAKEFINSFLNTSNNTMYTFIGKNTSWPDDTNPPAPAYNYFTENNAWHNIVALKKINFNDIKLVIPRIDWASGTKYTRFDDTITNLFSSNFYVLTLPEYKVYLCIDNNNNNFSFNKPTGTSTSIFQTADGYKWKYLYSLTDTDILKFLTLNYMPVNQNIDVAAASVGGQIHSFRINNGGLNFTSNPFISVKGNGKNFSGTVTLGSGVITGITINNPGNNYTYANVIITGNGSNANIQAIISPITGHGRDIFEDLGAHYVLLNTRLNYSEGNGDFPIVNEYRNIGIINNPIDSTGNIASALTLRATNKITGTILSGTFSLDENVTSNIGYSNATVLSANIETPNVVINVLSLDKQLEGNTAFSVGELITGDVSGATAKIVKIESSEFKNYSGKMLYIENREPITRAFDQAENIHIVIEF